ncbi:hypothetical protein YC2023_115223 [Brassica napus]
MLILGHGVKIKAPIKGINGWGIKSDTICFGGDEDDIFPSSDRCNRTTNCGVFDLATERLHDCLNELERQRIHTELKTIFKIIPASNRATTPERSRPNRIAILYSAETPRRIVAVNHTQIARP